jgi:cell wall-associated NlpC family hydrolase
VFYGAGGFADHVGISIGGGEMIEAPHTGDVVKKYSIATEVTYFGWYAVTDPLSSLALANPQTRHGLSNGQ